jgi:hypothetical protein
VLGATELAVVALALGWGAGQVRRLLLPGWTGAPALLADIVLALSALLVTGEVLGSVGLFRELPVLIGAVAVGLGASILARRAAAAPAAPLLSFAAHPAATAVALVAALLVVVHWGTFVGFSLDHGMWQSDSTWHNGPFAARFFQTGWITELHQTDPLTFLPWFYPQNSELLNGIGLLFFHNDLLTLFANVGWLLLALLAAWCIGRPWGAGPASVLGALVILDANNMLTSQPGEAKTDLIGIAFLLAAVALLVTAAARDGGARPAGPVTEKNGHLRYRRSSAPIFFGTTRWSGVLLVAGLAAGLALGSKYTLIPLVGVLWVGLIAVAKTERVRTAIWFGVPMLVTGGYWYLRNVVVSGSPLPQRGLDIGSIHLGTPQLPIDAYPQFSIAHYATDTAVWGTYFGPGLVDTFGSLWWATIGLATLGAVLALFMSGNWVLRVAGATVLVAGLVYLVTPTTAGGDEGMPKAFVYNVRYAVPALALGMAVLPCVPRLRNASVWRWGLLVVLFGLLLVTDGPLNAFESDYAMQAVVIAALVLAAPLALGVFRMRGAAIVPLAVAGLAVFVLAAALSRGEQTDYLRDRYTDTYPQSVHNRGLAAAIEWVKGVHDARIGIVGGTASNREYTFFNGDLSNRVQYIGVPGKRGAFYPVRDCETWRRRVNDGRYDYLVLSQRYVPGTKLLPSTGTEARWTRGDPNAELISDLQRVSVYRLTGPLDPRRCAPSRASA